MTPSPEISSTAFDRATLHSERYRIVGLLVVFGGVLVLLLLRAVFLASPVEIALLPWALLILCGFVVYEAAILLRLLRKIKSGQDFSKWVWRVNVFVETLFPTTALFLLTEVPFFGPYRALVAPAVLIYFLFIILSTLRLNPLLCWLTGIFSSAGYAMVVVYTFWHYPGGLNPDRTGFVLEVYISYAVFLFFGGGIAGVVAGEIRKHVSSALREAETRRIMEKMEHDLNIARSIQQSLLPAEAPAGAQFDIAGWNQPADQTGGDYFDWQTLPDQRIVLTLADSTGHGIGPALVASTCRAYARACFLSAGETSQVMDRLNGLLAADLPPERFVTFVAAILDPLRASLQLFSAGHSPLLYYRAGEKQVENFAAQGIPLGMIAGIPYESPIDIPMSPGDILVLVTDGFFEWANPRDEQYGTARVEEVLRANYESTAKEIIERLYASVLGFSEHSAQQDDLTAVIIKRKA
jgi:serine phosphatase RsbU (regulator of sigma subunit)